MRQSFTVKTLFGLEQVLADELQAMGLDNIEIKNRACLFEGTLDDAIRVNLKSRLALKVLTPMFEFEAFNEVELYKGIEQFDWEHLISPQQTMAVDAIVKSSFFNHSKYVALKTKDAIVDKIRKVKGRRPDVNPETPDIQITVTVNENKIYVANDLTGIPLYKRGYRQHTGVAPMNEVLAAGLIDLSGWDGQKAFYDGMCGSGTLLTEAAIKKGNIAPNLERTYFCFKHHKAFDPTRFEEIKSELSQQRKPIDGGIYGSDLSSTMIRLAQKNIESLGVDSDIDLIRRSIQKAGPPPVEPGVLIINPPYGERLAPSDINELYKTIGDTFKQQFAGWEAWLISSDEEAVKHVGLRPERRISLFNGSLPCKFLKYTLYTGTKKLHKQADLV
ncbi:MAG TPA: THUMP domain-containing protein [Luteibaculaceae bacterium]|nr:THUMP domain-containing protein [Luteibaculaceae bacterium]